VNLERWVVRALLLCSDGRYTAGPDFRPLLRCALGFHTMPSASSRWMRFRGSWDLKTFLRYRVVALRPSLGKRDI
jgi:hypothetical protein